MLDEIKTLGLSITDEQSERLREKLGDQWPAFLELVRSESEDEAEKKLGDFRDGVKALGMKKLMGIYALMTKKQKDLLSDLL